MTPEELDRILAGEDTVTPSTHFARNVMAAVRQEAVAPPPLRFPWFRFASGIAASCGMAWGGTALLTQQEVLAAPLPAAVPAVVFAGAVALVSLGLAAVPRLLSKP